MTQDSMIPRSKGYASKLFCVGVILLAACSSDKRAGQNTPKVVPVTVGTVAQKDIPVQLNVIGNVQAYSTVSVKAMVAGEVTRVYFTEGQEVLKGDLLFTIDPRPYEAAVKQAEANLARDLAQVKQAEANLNKALAQVKEAEAVLEKDLVQLKFAEDTSRRYENLLNRGVVAREQYDRFRTNAEVAEAAVRADRASLENVEAAVRSGKAALENAQATVQASRAALENARISLGYCSIRSPIDGRTGNLIVNQGNIVKANETPYLVIINQIHPIYVAFSIPEQHLSDVKRYMASGQLRVQALISSDEKRSEEGFLSFVDNTIDSATGTIRLKGTFANKEKRLWPGQFVTVALTLTAQPNAVVVPSQAVQTGQRGEYVFVVKSDATVELRSIVVSRSLDHETVVEKGLQPGETVVTDGQLQLVPGSRVEIKNSNTSVPSGGNSR